MNDSGDEIQDDNYAATRCLLFAKRYSQRLLDRSVSRL